MSHTLTQPLPPVYTYLVGFDIVTAHTTSPCASVLIWRHECRGIFGPLNASTGKWAGRIAPSPFMWIEYALRIEWEILIKIILKRSFIISACNYVIESIVVELNAFVHRSIIVIHLRLSCWRMWHSIWMWIKGARSILIGCRPSVWINWQMIRWIWRIAGWWCWRLWGCDWCGWSCFSAAWCARFTIQLIIFFVRKH